MSKAFSVITKDNIEFLIGKVNVDGKFVIRVVKYPEFDIQFIKDIPESEFVKGMIDVIGADVLKKYLEV